MGYCSSPVVSMLERDFLLHRSIFQFEVLVAFISVSVYALSVWFAFVRIQMTRILVKTFAMRNSSF